MEELKAMITDLRFLAAKTEGEEWTLEQVSQEALHLAGMLQGYCDEAKARHLAGALQEHLDEEQERTGIMERTSENVRREMTQRICSHLEQINSPVHLREETGLWTWKEETQYMPNEAVTIYFICCKGEPVDAFDEIEQLEAFTRGMLCYQTILNP